MIHQTAIVDPKAKISSNVKIGPYTVIGSNVEIGEIGRASCRERV